MIGHCQNNPSSIPKMIVMPKWKYHPLQQLPQVNRVTTLLKVSWRLHCELSEPKAPVRAPRGSQISLWPSFVEGVGPLPDFTAQGLSILRKRIFSEILLKNKEVESFGETYITISVAALPMLVWNQISSRQNIGPRWKDSAQSVVGNESKEEFGWIYLQGSERNAVTQPKDATFKQGLARARVHENKQGHGT